MLGRDVVHLCAQHALSLAVEEQRTTGRVDDDYALADAIQDGVQDARLVPQALLALHQRVLSAQPLGDVARNGNQTRYLAVRIDDASLAFRVPLELAALFSVFAHDVEARFALAEQGL